MLMAAAVVAVAAVGCSGDVAKQVTSNEQLRGQVMDAITKNPQFAMQQLDKFAASDSLRPIVVDHLLQNNEVAKQVIFRIATNANAIDLVLGLAVRDSALRSHVVTLVHGMEMASPRR
jgi:hypothetical protein